MVCVWVWIGGLMHGWVGVCVCVCVCVCVYECMGTCVWISVWVRTCMFVCWGGAYLYIEGQLRRGHMGVGMGGVWWGMGGQGMLGGWGGGLVLGRWCGGCPHPNIGVYAHWLASNLDVYAY